MRASTLQGEAVLAFIALLLCTSAQPSTLEPAAWLASLGLQRDSSGSFSAAGVVYVAAGRVVLRARTPWSQVPTADMCNLTLQGIAHTTIVQIPASFSDPSKPLLRVRPGALCCVSLCCGVDQRV